MIKELKAIFENGVLKPLEPLALAECEQVTIRIQSNGNSNVSKNGAPEPTTGSALVDYWQKEGLFGSHPEISDSVEEARKIRKEAESRNT